MAKTIISELNHHSTDLDDIIALYIACFNAPEKNENWTYHSAKEYFQQRITEGSFFLGIRENNSLVAVLCAGYAKKSFIRNDLDIKLDASLYISLVAVEKKHQGKGLGKQLLEEAIRLSHHKNYDSIVIRCRKENSPMLSLLQKLGFTTLKSYASNLGGVLCERVVSIKSLLLSDALNR